jgi:hypothetical protein
MLVACFHQYGNDLVWSVGHGRCILVKRPYAGLELEYARERFSRFGGSPCVVLNSDRSDLADQFSMVLLAHPCWSCNVADVVLARVRNSNGNDRLVEQFLDVVSSPPPDIQPVRQAGAKQNRREWNKRAADQVAHPRDSALPRQPPATV